MFCNAVNVKGDVCNLNTYNSFKSVKNISFTVGLCNEIGCMFALPYLPRGYTENVFVKRNCIVTAKDVQ
jgi:hypothetical protein